MFASLGDMEAGVRWGEDASRLGQHTSQEKNVDNAVMAACLRRRRSSTFGVVALCIVYRSLGVCSWEHIPYAHETLRRDPVLTEASQTMLNERCYRRLWQ